MLRILLLFSLFSTIYAFEQLLVVISDDINFTTATMQRYVKDGEFKKIGSSFEVTLARNGLGYDSFSLPLKNEGDGRAPAGLYPITSTFSYDENISFNMPHWHLDEHTYCVDDVDDARYNQILKIYSDLPRSYEIMKRADGVYRFGAVIGYNDSAVSGRGSCIFLHLNHSDFRPTSGCTALERVDLVRVLRWLDYSKKPHILQIPSRDCKKYQEGFRGIECE